MNGFVKSMRCMRAFTIRPWQRATLSLNVQSFQSTTFSGRYHTNTHIHTHTYIYGSLCQRPLVRSFLRPIRTLTLTRFVKSDKIAPMQPASWCFWGPFSYFMNVGTDKLNNPWKNNLFLTTYNSKKNHLRKMYNNK